MLPCPYKVYRGVYLRHSAQRTATFAGSIHLCNNYACYTNRLMDRLRLRSSLLPDCCINDIENLVRGNGCLYLLYFVNEVLVQRITTAGINYLHLDFLEFFKPVLNNLDRILLIPLPIELCIDLPLNLFKLIICRRSVYVCGYESTAESLFVKEFSQFTGTCSLTLPVKSDQHYRLGPQLNF